VIGNEVASETDGTKATVPMATAPATSRARGSEALTVSFVA